jgi:hypothetical protein
VSIRGSLDRKISLIRVIGEICGLVQSLALGLLATIVTLTLAGLLIGSHNWIHCSGLRWATCFMSCWLNISLALNPLSGVMVRNERPAIGSAALSSSPPVSVVCRSAPLPGVHSSDQKMGTVEATKCLPAFSIHTVTVLPHQKLNSLRPVAGR